MNLREVLNKIFESPDKIFIDGVGNTIEVIDDYEIRITSDDYHDSVDIQVANWREKSR